MKRTLLTAALVFVFAFTIHAQSKTYPAALKKYMEVSGSISAFNTAITGMIGNFKSANSNVPDEFWKELEAEFQKTSVDDLVTLLTPVYEKHITEAEMNEIIKFYNTPAGKKLAEKTPAIMGESMQVGQTWGAAVAQKVMTKLKEKGY